MKFAYGISDFRQIVTKGYFYCDRTDRIPMLEKAGQYLIFTRPERFGKSLLLSMLSHYYDIGKRDDFKSVFGQTAIGRAPTEHHSRYLILELDFFRGNSGDNARNISKIIHEAVNTSVEVFKIRYDNYLKSDITTDPENAVGSMESLIAAAHESGYPVYVLLDNYDQFTYELMLEWLCADKIRVSEMLPREIKLLKNLFLPIVSSPKRAFYKNRMFITGMFPEIISGISDETLQIEDISHSPDFNNLCGFSEAEVKAALIPSVIGCDQKADPGAYETMQAFYGGYIFSKETKKQVFNPSKSLYFIEHFYKTCKYPETIFDKPISSEDSWIRCLFQQSDILTSVIELLRPGYELILSEEDAPHASSPEKGPEIARNRSFLYHLGLLTLSNKTPPSPQGFKLSNLSVKRLCVDGLRRAFISDPEKRKAGKSSARAFFGKGDIRPLSEFIEKHCYPELRSHDLSPADPFAVKTLFMTFLFNDDVYLMDAEKPLGRSYADLTMITRPDKRSLNVPDMIIDFRCVTVGDAGIAVNDFSRISNREMKTLPAVKKEMSEAAAHLEGFGKILQTRYGKNLGLKKFAVVSLGFERLCSEEI